MGGHPELRSNKFFRQALLTGDPKLIGDMLTAMERNRKAITKDLATLVFYMQGGLSFEDSHLLSNEQRSAMSKVIEKHYEAASGKNNSKLIG